MFKTHLPLNKDTALILVMAFTIVVLLVVNVAFLLSEAVSVFLANPPATNKQLIDADTVNEAIGILDRE